MEKLNLLDKIIKESKMVLFKKAQPGPSFGSVGRYMSAEEALRQPVAATRPEVTRVTLRRAELTNTLRGVEPSMIIQDEVDSEAGSIQSDSVPPMEPMDQAQNRYLGAEGYTNDFGSDRVRSTPSLVNTSNGSTTTAASC